MVRILKKALITALIAGTVACAGTHTRESTGQFIDSSALTTKIKAKLVDKLGANGLEIKVKTYKDEVQLSGFVNNKAIKQKAGMIAASTPDVRHVRNDLIVK